jgi:NADH dehydrogenase FAD-containing subunit
VRDFRRIDPATARIVLVEAGPRLLPELSAGIVSGAPRRH